MAYFSVPKAGGRQLEDVLKIGAGEVCRRKKKPSKKFRDKFAIHRYRPRRRSPWKYRCLAVGAGMGALPVMEAQNREAKCRNVELLTFPTVQAIEILKEKRAKANAILHVTC